MASITESQIRSAIQEVIKNVDLGDVSKHVVLFLKDKLGSDFKATQPDIDTMVVKIFKSMGEESADGRKVKEANEGGKDDDAEGTSNGKSSASATMSKNGASSSSKTNQSMVKRRRSSSSGSESKYVPVCFNCGSTKHKIPECEEDENPFLRNILRKIRRRWMEKEKEAKAKLGSISYSQIRESIQEILRNADLSALSSKSVREQLEEKYHVDFNARKPEIDDILMSSINAIGEESAEPPPQTEAIQTAPTRPRSTQKVRRDKKVLETMPPSTIPAEASVEDPAYRTFALSNLSKSTTIAPNGGAATSIQGPQPAVVPTSLLSMTANPSLFGAASSSSNANASFASSQAKRRRTAPASTTMGLAEPVVNTGPNGIDVYLGGDKNYTMPLVTYKDALKNCTRPIATYMVMALIRRYLTPDQMSRTWLTVQEVLGRKDGVRLDPNLLLALRIQSLMQFPGSGIDDRLLVSKLNDLLDRVRRQMRKRHRVSGGDGDFDHDGDFGASDDKGDDESGSGIGTDEGMMDDDEEDGNHLGDEDADGFGDEDQGQHEYQGDDDEYGQHNDDELTGGEDMDDEALARKLHSEEMGGRSRAVKKKVEKKPKSTKSKDPADGTARKKGNSLYAQECVLSTELAEVMGTDRLARKDVVSRMWKIFKERELMDPKNKQYVLCDEQLEKVFKCKRVKAFSMMKILKSHIKDAKLITNTS